jgi:hypothetical protein
MNMKAQAVRSERVNFVNPLANTGLELITHQSDQFESTLRYFLSPDDIRAVEPLLPYCVIVRNKTGRLLAGVTMLYTARHIPTLSMASCAQ